MQSMIDSLKYLHFNNFNILLLFTWLDYDLLILIVYDSYSSRLIKLDKSNTMLIKHRAREAVYVL